MNTAEAQAARPLASVSAADRAYAYVKGEILARRFAPHDLLSEGQLAGAVGASRTPVREALLRLQGEGLVRLLPKRGALVLPVTVDEMADVMETRRLVETFAARKVLAQPSAALGPVLERHLDAMRAAMEAHDVAAYVQADRDFHLAIVAATGNEIITSLYRSLRERQLRMGTVNLLDGTGTSVDPARMQSTLAEHERIRDALRAGRADAVVKAVGAHLDHAQSTLARRP
ncbi:MAG TPA: GntR family transcriptional regulator [Streptosporangiaceae bacterium]|jgi:DNA-binding GntR family transcriptional regulator|nr:GntR family transcriptional regulator [Streptosporangiaceae bacterium]